jgi:hypothetical protein
VTRGEACRRQRARQGLGFGAPAASLRAARAYCRRQLLADAATAASRLVSQAGGVTAMADDRDSAKVIDVAGARGAPTPSRKPRRKRGAEAKASPLLPDEQGESE